ncbi:HAD family phosphatase, partial [bacterium]|nr:HAD family phosphatase [bacterium]
MTPSKAILFDYDGVLVASEPIHLLAWMQLLDELNLPKDQELILQSVGKTAPEIILKLLQKYQPTEVHSLEKCRELAQRKNFHYL